MSQTLLELTNQINAHPAPLLFLDTCTILDPIQVLCREELSLDEITATKELLLKATAQPRQLWVVICYVVATEWQSKMSTVSDELQKKIEKCQRELTKFSDILQLLSITYPHSNLTQFSLETHLVNLSRSVFRVSQQIARDNDCVIRAEERNLLHQAPSSPGKQEMKDCTIVEHYLELCRQLRTTGFNQKVIFVSSNVKDYGNPSKSIRPPLDTQFSNLGIQFVTRLNWAMSLMRGGGM